LGGEGKPGEMGLERGASVLGEKEKYLGGSSGGLIS